VGAIVLINRAGYLDPARPSFSTLSWKGSTVFWCSIYPFMPSRFWPYTKAGIKFNWSLFFQPDFKEPAGSSHFSLRIVCRPKRMNGRLKSDRGHSAASAHVAGGRCKG